MNNHEQSNAPAVGKYEKPTVQRFGTIHELTLGGGPQTTGDATNLYHRS